MKVLKSSWKNNYNSQIEEQLPSVLKELNSFEKNLQSLPSMELIEARRQVEKVLKKVELIEAQL